MGRPRADGPRAPAQPRTRPERAASKRSAGTGIAGGSGVAAVAQLLPPPYQAVLSLVAPALSVLIAAWGPRLLDAVTLGIEYFVGWCKHAHALRRHRVYLARQRKRLKEQDLTPERRKAIEDAIEETQASIDRHEYRWVSPYLIGDTTSGIKTEPGPSGETPADALPPEAEGEGK
jgi:hypothetical protein